MEEPLVTVGITAFQASDTLETAIFSALQQNWKYKQIIIVDDYSNDETVELLETLKKQYSALNIYARKQNGGVAVARNDIIAQAQGEFIAFFDDDDVSDPDRLRMQYERIIACEREFKTDMVICHTARTQIYPDGTKRYEPTMGMEDGAVPHGTAAALRMLTGKPMAGGFGATATCSQMARTAIYKNLGGFDPAFRRSEDTDFNIRAAQAGAYFAGVSAPLVTQTMTMASDKRLAGEKKYAFMLLEKHRAFIDRHNSYQFCCRWLSTKYDFLNGRKVKFGLKILKLFFTNPIRTAQRSFWALPNASFNLKSKAFHDGTKA